MFAVQPPGTVPIDFPYGLELGFDVDCHKVKVGEDMLMANDHEKVSVYP